MTNGLKKQKDAIEGGASFVVNNPQIVSSVSEALSYNDEPKLYQYSSYFKDKYNLLENSASIASGVSFNKKNAMVKLLGETIERYALTLNNNMNFIYKSFNELDAVGRLALNPKDILQTLDKRIHQANIPSAKLHWIEGISLISNKKVLVPAQLSYAPYVHDRLEPALQMSTSTGAASGTSLDDAIYRGICEVVERDSFMIHYLNKISSPRIDLSSIKDKAISNIVVTLKRYKLDLTILDLTTDLQIPVFTAVLLDRTGLGPAVSVGLKAGFDLKHNIIGAIEESLMTRSWIRDEFIYLDPKHKRKKVISTIEDRAHFWLSTSTIKYLDFWIHNNVKKIRVKNLAYSGNKLKKAVRLLKERKIEAICVDIADKKIKKYGFVVVKIIIPQLQPLYLDEGHRYLEGKRLYSTPVNMGFLTKSRTKDQLNKIPHPFL